jgi:hypothetical protein
MYRFIFTFYTSLFCAMRKNYLYRNTITIAYLWEKNEHSLLIKKYFKMLPKNVGTTAVVLSPTFAIGKRGKVRKAKSIANVAVKWEAQDSKVWDVTMEGSQKLYPLWSGVHFIHCSPNIYGEECFSTSAFKFLKLRVRFQAHVSIHDETVYLPVTIYGPCNH